MNPQSLPTRTRLIFRTQVADFVFDLEDLNFFPEIVSPLKTQEVVVPVHALFSFIWSDDSSVEPELAIPTPQFPDPDAFAPNLHYNPPCSQLESTFFSPLGSLPTLPDFPSVQGKEIPFLSQAKRFIETNPLILSPEGVGGTYFVQDSSGSPSGVFKPVDEEPGAPNNPKKFVSEPLLPPGGGAIREVAAYLLDHEFSGVPPTFLLENIATNNLGIKTGSVQQFMLNDGDSSSVGSTSFAVDDVHRIGVLDIRLLNLDRNGENILLRKEGKEHRLIPIDHTYILSEKLDGAFFEWMYWSQTKKPFSQGTLDFIGSIDLDSDAKVLRDLGISELSVQTMIMCTILLKRCASVGKNLYEIATLVCRDFSGNLSQLEILSCQTASLVGRQNTRAFCDSFSSLVNETFPVPE